MSKRYQVFVSSTFIDLQEERRQAIQTVMELDCFPAGMELFPAAVTARKDDASPFREVCPLGGVAAAPKVGDPKVGTFEHIHAPIATGDAVGAEAI
jgi:hypothetical protein